MKDVVDHARSFAAKHRLWLPDSRVAAAVSGGSDSVALLFILRELANRGEIVLAGLAHLNHHIRGAEAEADAAFCRALAERIGVPALIGDADVPAASTAHGVSMEVAGRHARRSFFDDARAALHADVVAVAHTRDDQAETVLLRLTRGAGGGGLAAMQPRRDRVVRPLLDCTREQLQQFLRERGEAWREDATNADRSIPRNRIRHDVMPSLRAINVQADAALARAAEILRGDEEFLERLANAAFLKCVDAEDRDGLSDSAGARVKVDAVELAKLPTALARRVSRYALETANPDRTYGLEDADGFVAALRAGITPNIPELFVERFGDTVVLANRPPGPAATVADVELRLDIPGTVEAPHGAWTVTAEGPRSLAATVRSDAAQVTIDAEHIGSHLIVRHRRPGDRLRPLGAPGSKKVQDVLVDRKVPRDERDLVPIITTEAGEIVWVAGEVLADSFRVTPRTTSVVVLTLRR
mgnify:CR=1 FL=1